MAYVRLAQTGFEYRMGAEMVITTGNGSPNVLDTVVHTGAFSLNSGSDRANFGGNRMVDQIRSNWFAYYTGSGTGNVLAVHGVKAEASKIIRFQYASGTDTFDLYDNEVLQVQIPAPGAGWQPSSFIAVGCTAKAGATGWVSLYLDGNLVYRYDGYHFTTGEIGSVGTSSAVYLDDVYVDECTAGEADNAPSSPRFFPLQVIANGENDDWYPMGAENSRLAVRNVAIPSGVMENNLNAVPPFLFASAADLKTDWSFPAPPTDERIRAIIPYAIVQKGRAELSTQLRFFALDGGVQLNSPDLDIPSAAQIVWHRFPLDANGIAWDYNALVRSTFGVESRGAF